jgi:hypothetical protein
MSFFAPLLLFGLLATLIPPLLHLLNRKEAKPVPFPAMEFLKRAYRKTARRMKIKQWILILIRSLLLALLAFALARPYWQPQANSSGILDRIQVKCVTQILILDVSYPMGYQVNQDQKETLLSRAKTHIHSVIDQANGPLELIIASKKPLAIGGGPNEDYSQLRNAVDQVQLNETPMNLDDAFQLAFQFLKERPLEEQKSIILLTTPHYQDASLPLLPQELGKVAIQAVDLTQGQVLNHLTLLNATLSPAPRMGIGQWQVDVEVANWSDVSVQLWPIAVEVEGRVLVRGFLNLNAGETGRKRMYFKADPLDFLSSDSGSKKKDIGIMGLKGRVVLDPDPLPLDNTFPFWIEPNPPTRVFALNGDPRPTPQDDEFFYLRHALSPVVTGGDRFTLEIQPSNGADLDETALNGVDVVILANIPRPSRALGARLDAFVKEGGGVWIALGNRVDVDAWNMNLGSLLPRPLRGIRQAGDAANVTQRKVARLTKFKAQHPLLTLFKDPLRSTLPQAKVWTYFLFDPQPNQGSEVISSLNEGSPYFLTQKVDKGRVLVFGGPLDREWSDLVIRPDFVPLTQQVIRYLTQVSTQSASQVKQGQKLIVELSGKGPFSSISPTGERSILGRIDDQKEQVGISWQVHSTDRLGHYLIENNEQKSVARFVSLLDRQGSDLRQQGSQKKTSSSHVQKATLQTQSRTDLWPLGLFGLFILLGLESLVLFQKREERIA